MRRKRLPPAPQGDPNGTWLPDQQFGGEVFVTFEELNSMCSEMLTLPDNLTGKDHWRNDPTYNMRRKRNGNKV
jgi:hypothetical protein